MEILRSFFALAKKINSTVEKLSHQAHVPRLIPPSPPSIRSILPQTRTPSLSRHSIHPRHHQTNQFFKLLPSLTTAPLLANGNRACQDQLSRKDREACSFGANSTLIARFFSPPVLDCIIYKLRGGREGRGALLIDGESNYDGALLPRLFTEKEETRGKEGRKQEGRVSGPQKSPWTAFN